MAAAMERWADFNSYLTMKVMAQELYASDGAREQF
jgi:hypothetical protein